MRYYLKGPIGEREMELELQEELLALLAPEASTGRDYFLQKLWNMFFDLLAEEYLDETSRGLIQVLPAECQRLVLHIYGRGSRGEESSVSDKVGRTKAVANLLAATWSVYAREANSKPVFLFPNRKGILKKKSLDINVRSPDAATAWFFVDKANQISQVSTYTVVFEKSFSYWRYEYVKNGSLGRPKRINNPRKTEGMHYIRPVL